MGWIAAESVEIVEAYAAFDAVEHFKAHLILVPQVFDVLVDKVSDVRHTVLKQPTVLSN